MLYLFTSFPTERLTSCTIFHFHHIPRTKTNHFLNKNPQNIKDICVCRFFLLILRAGISRRAIAKTIAKLQAEGILRRVGPVKGGHWEIVE